MRAVDTLTNVKNWPAYDYKAYRLDKDEAQCCTDALENYIWHDVKKEGMPNKSGSYLYKVKLSNDRYSYWSGYVENGVEAIAINDNDVNFEYEITHWRKIIDNDNAYYGE